MRPCHMFGEFATKRKFRLAFIQTLQWRQEHHESPIAVRKASHKSAIISEASHANEADDPMGGHGHGGVAEPTR